MIFAAAFRILESGIDLLIKGGRTLSSLNAPAIRIGIEHERPSDQPSFFAKTAAVLAAVFVRPLVLILKGPFQRAEVTGRYGLIVAGHDAFTGLFDAVL